MNIEIAKDNQITIKELLARQALRDHFAGLAMQTLLRHERMLRAVVEIATMFVMRYENKYFEEADQ